MNFIFTSEGQSRARLDLKKGRATIDSKSLTISQGFDKLLIVSIDKLAARNKIDRLSIKSLKIQGFLKDGAVSSMILRSISAGLKI